MALWAVLVAVAALAGLVYLFYRPPDVSRARRLVVIALWYLGVAGPLGLLLNPSWVETARAETARARLVVLVDTSQSMATKDVEGRERIAAAVEDITQAAGDLAADFDAQFLAFDDGTRPARADGLSELKATGDVTDIAGALAYARESIPEKGGAILLVSDGADNASEGPEAAYQAAGVAQALGIPVYTRAYGGASSGKDISIEVASPRELAFVGQKAVITAAVHQRGFEGGLVTVTLSDGKSEIERRDVALGPASTTSVSFDVEKDQSGVYLYELTASSAPEEVTRLNNRCAMRLIVVDDAIKVLVLEGKAYWDFRFLLRALALDEAVDVTGVVRLTNRRLIVRRLMPGEMDGVDPLQEASNPPKEAVFDEKVELVNDPSVFLADPERLKEYQVIILGRDTECFLTEAGLHNLRSWVGEGGGSLVLARGKPMPIVSEKFDPLVPVTWAKASEGRLRVKLTPFGQSLRWFPWMPSEPESGLSDKMPSIATEDVIRDTKPLATVVARAEGAGDMADMPVMTYMPYGSGRTLAIEGAGMWRWAFLAPKYESYRSLYSFFWASLLRWLVSSTDFLPSQTCALRPSQPLYTTREKPVIFALVKPEEAEFGAANPPVIEITPDGGGEAVTVATVPVGRDVALFKAVPDKLPVGFYEAHLKRTTDGAPAECVFQVQPPLREQLDVAARPKFLAQLASLSGGNDVTGQPLSSVRSAYATYWLRTHPSDTRRSTAWDRLWVMLAAVTVWSIAWVVRRRGGLI